MTTTDIDRLRDDVGYVRAVLRRTCREPMPPAILYLWAAIVLVGFTLIDVLRDDRVGIYWAIAGPGGAVLSGLLGWWDSRRRGVIDRAEGTRHMLHWGAMLVAIFAAQLLVATGQIEPSGVGPVILLLLALGYVTVGLHLDGGLVWLGLLIGAGYGFVLFVPGPVWTITGVVLAVAFVATGILGGRRRAAASRA